MSHRTTNASIYCRPLRVDIKATERMSVPELAGSVPIAILPPLSGLRTHEVLLGDGALNGLIGQGRTAEVVRNLCLRVHRSWPDDWDSLVGHISDLFGVQLDEPHHSPGSDEIMMTYRERGIPLDFPRVDAVFNRPIDSLVHICQPGATLLIDEPDAHLEVPVNVRFTNWCPMSRFCRRTGGKPKVADPARSGSEAVIPRSCDGWALGFPWWPNWLSVGRREKVG